MAEHHAAVDAEEQIDLDGDNDIEDMMDDEDPVEDDPEEDNYMKGRGEYAEDDSYKKARGVYAEDDGYRKTRDQHSEEDDYRKVQNESFEEEHGSEVEAPNKVASNDVANDPSRSFSDEDGPVGSKNEEDSEKHAELLALPPHGSEVFIGGLPRDATEEDLRELYEPLGESYEIREVKLVKDKDSKENKGFAFITFTTKDGAQKAIDEIHDKQFKGRTLRCSLSQAKFRLFIGNVPKNLTEEELKKILEDNGPGVENVECFKDPQNPSRNRGFLFVEYYNNACAEYSRQKMTSADFKLDGSKPTVTWADPKNSSDSSGGQVKAIYLKNLPENVTQEKLKELFERHGEITKVVLPPAKSGQKRDFGFIHFAERSSALKAVRGTEKYEIDGQVVEANLAKAQSEKNHASNSNRSGLLAGHPQYPPYGYSGDPYGAYGAGYGSANSSQPVIYGRGPMPSGMRMVPMVLPDGRLGYVLQQPGSQAPPPPSRRSDRRDGGSSDGRNSDGNRSRRHRPY